MSIADERYVLLTTFRKDGSPVRTPVWIAPLSGGEACFTTSGDAGKVKRINRTPRVTLQPCDMRGRIKAGGTPSEGTARVVTGPDFAPVEKAVAKKYGIQYRLVVWSGTLTSFFKRTKTADAGIVITLG
ncbi:MAG: hypothetical protein B7C54_05155 [Acidimicrobiales bacterium mtb01]|nr:PPOX class F420-dependent oxidoreductase [Actinomycetota bacterium]TEX46597.1 MAG: hypothetical protein B7C54_05155 [Acidimicrobiales bacterium mtb01]